VRGTWEERGKGCGVAGMREEAGRREGRAFAGEHYTKDR